MDNGKFFIIISAHALYIGCKAEIAKCRWVSMMLVNLVSQKTPEALAQSGSRLREEKLFTSGKNDDEVGIRRCAE